MDRGTTIILAAETLLSPLLVAAGTAVGYPALSTRSSNSAPEQPAPRRSSQGREEEEKDAEPLAVTAESSASMPSALPTYKE